MRILVVHNQLWAHYKSILFEEIHQVIHQEHPDSNFLVAQIALYEQSRAAMAGKEAVPEYNYPYKVLFERSLDSVTFFERFSALLRLYHSFRPDVLNITGYFDYAQVLLFLYAKIRGIKTIISSESSAVDRPRSGWREALKRYVLRYADAFFCFGTTSVDYLASLGIPLDKIAVRHAAVVDNERIIKYYQLGLVKRKNHQIQNFIFVGRLAPEKNLMTLLEAYSKFSQIANFGQQWGLIFVGDGPERENLEKYIDENTIPNITFSGGVTWQQVPFWLAQADVLILPSTSEPWGLVVNEAMLCGMPVIVSDRCGCAEDLVKSGQNGYLIDPYIEENLLEAMKYYGDFPHKIQQHGQASLQLVAPFSAKSVAKNMVDSFHNITNTN